MNFSPATHSAEDIVRLLRLEPLPQEGGYFRRTGEGPTVGPTAWGPRRAWSTILALYTPPQFSALHRLAHDELWSFNAGDPLEMVLLQAGGPETVRLGATPNSQLHHVVPADRWQGARVATGGAWSLVTCMVVPEFLWADFELGRRETLESEFPTARPLIRELTRE